MFLCKRRFSPNDDENFDDDYSYEKKKKKKKKKREEGGGGGDASTNTSPFQVFLKKMKEIHTRVVKKEKTTSRAALWREGQSIHLRARCFTVALFRSYRQPI